VIDIPSVEQTHSSGAVPRRGVTIVRASGAHLFDGTGRRWIDCSAAHGWAALGHSHPAVTEAIRAQAGRIVMLTESASNDARARWFTTLTKFLARDFPETDRGPLTRIAAANSGAEAIEAALKFARIRTGRTGVVAFTRGFHGRTFGALSATAPSPRRDKFAPLVPGFAHATYNDLASAASKIGDDTAAVIVEIVQGEGGVHEGTTDFLQGIAALARDRGALLIVDEIQTGFGRTGRWFASSWHQVNPDIVVLGKALGGGLPLGAAVWRRDLGGFEPGFHGSTFAGAPLVAAASVAAMEAMIAEGLAERANRLGAQVMTRLRAGHGPAPTESQPSQVRAVRGRGLMIGIELKGKVAPIIERLMERGVWALPAGLNVLRLLPPLNIPESDLDFALDAITETLRSD
jgi:acetylornithine/LysW-gamma-L-lysine aminotransferase